MNKLFIKWQDTSHRNKAFLLLAATILIVLLSYVICGCPPLSAEMAMRQEEMQNMIGPSQIIAEFQQETIVFEDVIVGRTEHIYTIFSYSREDRVSDFAWYERTENMALYAVPGSFPQTSTLGNIIPLNLILFDTEPKAKRAEIEVEITYQQNETYTKTFSAEALREHDGFFILPVRAQDHGISSVNSAGLHELMRRCSGYNTNGQPVTVRLYDENDQLIRTETITAGPAA